MNYLWAFMILSGVLFSAFHGTIPAVTGAVLDSAKEAVTLCITMTGVMSFWMGLMRIAERGGVIAGLSRKLKPVLRFLFPQIPPEHVANEQIAANMEVQNDAAKRKKDHRTKPAPVPRGTANAEMCTLLIMNISSLQLIPVNIIAFRSQYGSVNPAEIIGPAILATVISTITAVIFCKFAQKLTN